MFLFTNIKDILLISLKKKKLVFVKVTADETSQLFTCYFIQKAAMVTNIKTATN